MDPSICIIDDYNMNVILAKLIIRQEGSFKNVTSYTEAEEAFNYLMKNQNNEELLPDVILLDLNMPFMDGWQFLDKFDEVSNSLKKNILIFILSSSIDPHDYERSKKYASVKDFFSKPLSPAMLTRAATMVASLKRKCTTTS